MTTALECGEIDALYRYLVTRSVDGTGNATVLKMTNDLDEARSQFLDAAGDRATSRATIYDMGPRFGAAIAEYKRAVALW